jgi:hypothetical protein
MVPSSKKELQGQVKGVLKACTFFAESNRQGQLMVTDKKTKTMIILQGGTQS